MNRTTDRSNDLLSTRASLSTSSVIRDLLRLVDRPDMLSLAGGLPAPEHLPVARVAEAASRVLHPRALQYGPTEGMVELREVVGARVDADPDRIVVTTGSQQGLDLVARAVIDPGDVVVVESPSYLGSLQSFRASGAQLVAFEGDREGMRVDLLAEALAGGLRPKLVSVVTDFANPTGATLSLDRRRLLAALADRYGFLVVEDNPYGELRWQGESLPAIATMSDLVVTLGSASKVLAPGLRLGWLRGPASIRDAVVRLKQSTDLHTSSLDQLLAADVLGDAVFMAGHLARICADYANRAEALTGALVAALGNRIDVARPDGGMFVWARLTSGESTAAVFERALAAGVAFVPGQAFAVDDRVCDTMRLCFTTLRVDQLRTAVERLAGVVALGADGRSAP